MRVATLNCGVGMPRIGFGTVAPWSMAADDGCVEKWVKDATNIGFRYFDSAPMFRTKEEYEDGLSRPEMELGKALRDLMTTKKMKRSEFFIASKCGNTYHSRAKARECLELTLRNMDLDYLDLYIMASPCGIEEGGDLAPMDDKGNLKPSGVDYLETWEAMEGFVNEGLVCAIGVSNFSLKQLKRLLQNCKIKPAVLQIEVNAFWVDKALISFAQKENVHVTAFSPFGAPERPWATEDTPNLLKDEKVLKVAEEVKHTAPQVLIRYCFQMGLSVVVRGTSPTNMEQNYNMLAFMLTDEHLKTLDSLNKRDGRAIYLPELMQHPDYPFYDFSDNELAKEAGGGDDKSKKKEGGGTRDSAVHHSPTQQQQQQQQKSKNRNDDDENNWNQEPSTLDANFNQDFDEMSPGVEV